MQLIEFTDGILIASTWVGDLLCSIRFAFLPILVR